MFKPIRSLCDLLDAFGLPRVAGNLHTDRFIVANESFLRIVGLEKDEIASLALSEVVKIHFASTDLSVKRKAPGGCHLLCAPWHSADNLPVEPQASVVADSSDHRRVPDRYRHPIKNELDNCIEGIKRAILRQPETNREELKRELIHNRQLLTAELVRRLSKLKGKF
jgi:hypothetical protein